MAATARAASHEAGPSASFDVNGGRGAAADADDGFTPCISRPERGAQAIAARARPQDSDSGPAAPAAPATTATSTAPASSAGDCDGDIEERIARAHLLPTQQTLLLGSPLVVADVAEYARRVAAKVVQLAASSAQACSRPLLLRLAGSLSRLCAVYDEQVLGAGDPPPSGAPSSGDAGARPRFFSALSRGRMAALLEGALRWQMRLPSRLRAGVLDWPTWASFRDLSVCELGVAVAVLRDIGPLPHGRQWARLLRDIEADGDSREAKRDRFAGRIGELSERLLRTPDVRQVLAQMHASQRRQVAEHHSTQPDAGPEMRVDQLPHMRRTVAELQGHTLRHLAWLKDEIDPSEEAAFARDFTTLRELCDTLAIALERIDGAQQKMQGQDQQVRRAQLATLQVRRSQARAQRRIPSVAWTPKSQALLAAVALPSSLPPLAREQRVAPGLAHHLLALEPLTRTLVYHLRSVLESRLVLPASVLVPHALVQQGEQLVGRLRALGLCEAPAWRTARRGLAAALGELRQLDTQARADDLLWAQVQHIYEAQPQLAEVRARWAALAARLAQAGRRTDAASLTAAGVGEAAAAPPDVAPCLPPRLTPEPSQELPSGDEDDGPAAPPSPRLRAFVDAHFDPGTFSSAWRSARYHFLKHAAQLEGASLRAYIERARQLVAADPGYEVCRRISDPQALLRMVNTPDTYLIYAADGRIVSYRDRRARPYI